MVKSSQVPNSFPRTGSILHTSAKRFLWGPAIPLRTSQILQRILGPGPGPAGQPLSGLWFAIWPFITSSVGTYHSSPTTQSAHTAYSLEVQSELSKPRLLSPRGPRCPAHPLSATLLQTAGPAQPSGHRSPEAAGAVHLPQATKGGFTNQRGRENKAVTSVRHEAGSQNNAGQSPVALSQHGPAPAPWAPGRMEKHPGSQLAVLAQTWEVWVSAGSF